MTAAATYRSVRLYRLIALLAILGMLMFGLSTRAANQVASAEELTNESAVAAANRLVTATGGQLAIRYSEATGVARFVRAVEGTSIPLSGDASSPEDKAYAFFEQYGAMFGVTAARDQLRVVKVISDDGGTSVRLDQFHGALPVFNVRMMVHINRAGAITAVNGTFVPNIKVRGFSALSADSASSAAVNAVTASTETAAGTQVSATKSVLGVHKLGMAADEPGRQVLAWQVEVSSTAGTPVHQFLYVDAADGSIVESFNAISEALNRRNYDAHFAPDYSQITVCRDEGDPPSTDSDCNDAYDFAGDTYNFFWNGFRRDAIDDEGGTLLSVVNYNQPGYCPNASWNGQFMTYCPGLEKDDVVSHELTHGVTQYTANLVYAYQSGALNESFSDIFGESLDLMNSSENEPNSRWLVGEGVVGFPNGFRDMQDPTANGNPDSCSSELYWCDSGDSGGVHVNSGVPNKAYTLMVDGGTFGGHTITGIGLNRALAVQYRALSQYLTPYSNFTDNFEALVAACDDLVGTRVRNADPEGNGGAAAFIYNNHCTQIRKAALAVDMTQEVCTDVGPDPAGPRCTGNGGSKRIFFDNQDGERSRMTQGADTELFIVRFRRVGDFSFSGDMAWRIDNPLTDCSSGDATSDAWLQTPFINLTGTQRPSLRFVHDFNTEGAYDGGIVEVLINDVWVKVEARDFFLNGYNGEIDPQSTAPIANPASPEAFTGYRTPGDYPNLNYAESRADLSTYAALDTDKSIRIRFRFAQDYCNGTDIGWYIDDVEVYDCPVPALALVGVKD